MKHFCGVDIGASSAKLVIVDDAGRTVGRVAVAGGVDGDEERR